MECWLCVRHCAYLPLVVASEVGTIHPFYRPGHRGLERLSNWIRATKIVSVSSQNRNRDLFKIKVMILKNKRKQTNQTYGHGINTHEIKRINGNWYI